MSCVVEDASIQWASLGEDDDPDLIDWLERTILSHQPHSAEEAAAMLDVVAVNVSTGQRSDGLDVRAVESVANWLRGENGLNQSGSLFDGVQPSGRRSSRGQ